MSNQKEAIEKIQGPCVIFAGAGTGKTYTIVEKIKFLINNKIFHPEEILCLTFSNEAAKSLSLRVMNQTESENQPIIKTFHSFCADLLKKHGEKIGISKKFKILLPDDAKILLHKSFQTTPYNCHQYIEAISTAKDLGISISDFEKYISEKNNNDSEKIKDKIESLTLQLHSAYIKKDDSQKSNLSTELENLNEALKLKKFLQTWKAYEKIKDKKSFQDYSDLNKNALVLLDKFPELAKEFKYVIIDEFQDTNKIQCDLIRKLSPNKNITIVGDMNQSIYRFRGAYKDNLSNFIKDFDVQKADKFVLDKSYRSTNRILNISSKLIKQNPSEEIDLFEVTHHKDVEGDKIKVFELQNQREESRKILEIIKKEIDKGTPLKEICVMFRTHQQARMIKNFLEEENLPYTSVTKKPLLKYAPIRKIIDYLTILDKLKLKTKGGEQAWWDLVFRSYFQEEDLISFSKYLKSLRGEDCPSLKILNEYKNIEMTENGKIRLQLIINSIKNLIPEIENSLSKLILKVYNSTEFSSTEHPSYKESMLSLEKFISLTEEYAELDEINLHNFLRHLEIITNLGLEVEAPQTENEGIRIMTNHSTKGLEYDVVIVGSLVQKRFPMQSLKKNLIPQELSPEITHLIKDKSQEDAQRIIQENEQKNQLSEERRLCYVAFTRAKKRLYLTYAKEYGNRKHQPSQFLSEIDWKNNQNIEFEEDSDLKVISKRQITEKNNLDSWTKPNLDIKKIVFSPSALQTFNECQRKYEYKYIYNMPDPLPVSWDAMKLGSFIHLVIEKGVKANYKTEKEFLDLARTLQTEDEWSFVNLEEALPIIKVFFVRNKDKYNEKSLTEQKLDANIEGLRFFGIADRIDFHETGLEIIDYKTGSSDIKPKYRNWQLGFYALASQKFGKPKKLTLDMLKKEKPIEFILEDDGTAKEINSKRTSFNLHKVKEEIVQTAKEIIRCRKEGFKTCPAEKNCSFCNEFFWEN